MDPECRIESKPFARESSRAMRWAYAQVAVRLWAYYLTKLGAYFVCPVVAVFGTHTAPWWILSWAILLSRGFFDAILSIRQLAKDGPPIWLPSMTFWVMLEAIVLLCGFSLAFPEPAIQGVSFVCWYLYHVWYFPPIPQIWIEDVGTSDQ